MSDGPKIKGNPLLVSVYLLVLAATASMPCSSISLSTRFSIDQAGPFDQLPFSSVAPGWRIHLLP